MSEVTTAMSEEEAQNRHWYIKINKRESGPYRYSEILLMIHNQDVKQEDQITCRGLGGWKALSDFQHFSEKSIKKYFEENELDPEDHDAIHFRKSMRVPLKETILAVSGNQLFKALCLDVSTGGCMIKVPRGRIPLDSMIKIHIYENENKNCPAFNLKGKVIRVISQERRSEGETLFDHLGIEFLLGKKSQREVLQSTLRDMVFNYKEEKIEETFKRAA
jgi:hypothetical protein